MLIAIAWFQTFLFIEFVCNGLDDTVKPLNGRHLRVLKNLSVIERCSLLGGNLKKIVTFGTKCFVLSSRHIRYLGCPLLRDFTVLQNCCSLQFY